MKCVADTASAIKFLEEQIESLEYFTNGDPTVDAMETIEIISRSPDEYRDTLTERLALAKQALAELQPLPQASDTTPSIPVDVPAL